MAWLHSRKHLLLSVRTHGACVWRLQRKAPGLLLMRAPVSVCPQEVFQVGDRVRAVVLSQEDYSRFSLSTAELEEQPGDMLRDKVRS